MYKEQKYRQVFYIINEICFGLIWIDFTSRIPFCSTWLLLGFSAKLRIWQVPTCNMEPRSGNIFYKNLSNWPTWPTSQSSLRSFFCIQCCAASPPQLFPSLTKYVRCPPPLPAPIVHPIKKVGAVSSPQCSPLPLPHSSRSLILRKNIWTYFYVRCPPPLT